MDPLPHVVAPTLHYAALPRSEGDPRMGSAITVDREAGAPIALIGCPTDAGIATRAGARFGPDGIRQQLAKLTPWTGSHALPTETPFLCDLGNVEVVPTGHAATLARLETAWEAALKEQPDCFPITLGGDHSCTAPAFTAIQRHLGRQLGLIVFDAHYDVREYDDQHLSSGTPFRRILELGPNAIAGRNLVYIGIRPFANAESHYRWLMEHGAWCFTVNEVRERGIAEITSDAIKLAAEGTDGIYCSVDIDAVDQGDAPGASATGPGGLRGSDLLDSLQLIARSGRLVGLDVMEVAPPLDFNDMTSKLAAASILTTLAGRREVMGDRGR